MAPAASVPLPLVDLSALPAGPREAEALRLAGAEARAPFDLEHGPVLRARLLRLAAEEHLLALTVHHIAADGWSLGVLLREVAALYAGSPLPPLPVQYADFAVWQRRWLAGAALERETAWWRGELAGAPPALDLPADRPRPAVRGARGAHLTFRWPVETASGVAVLARRAAATPFMILLGLFQSLLARHAGREDVVVGVPVAGRDRTEIEGLIGFFVNTLVLRTSLGGDPAFLELIARVRRTALGAWEHQHLPFEKLVEELAPQRDPSRTPLVQVAFAFQNVPRPEVDLGGLRLLPVEVSSGTAKFDLTVTLEEREGGIEGAVEHDTGLFDATTVRRLLGHFEILAAAAVADPARRLSELPWLSEAERHQTEVEWADARRPYPRESGLAELFAGQVRSTPQAVAVEQGDRRVTYGELDALAGRLAAHLRALGVGPEVAVGLCAGRSPELIVAILAVVKAGGTYVPLDPAYPAERLAFMLADSGAAVLLVDERHRDALPAGGRPVVVLGREPASGPETGPAAGPLHLAYVMYTSGSTGRPKGVAVPQRGVVRLVCGAEYIRFGPQEVFLQLTPTSFDVSTLEIWGTLLHGGRLVLAPPGALTLGEIGEVVARYGITTLWLTAGLFHQMVDEALPGLRPVRQLLAGGDVLSPPHVRRVLEELPGILLVN
ncbi:MAG TPA: condensation domain-containing protein, partial [Streptomyces sp.]